MRAIEFSSEVAANARNREQARKLGCGDSAGDTTTYWWPMEQINGQYYLLIGEDEVEDEVVEVT